MEYAATIALGVHSEYLNALGIYSDYTVKKSNFHLKYKEVLNDQGCNIEKLCQFRYNDKMMYSLGSRKRVYNTKLYISCLLHVHMQN